MPGQGSGSGTGVGADPGGWPSETALRETLCEIGRRVWARGYVAASDGNFSARLGPAGSEAGGLALCSPTMVSKGFMEPDDLVVVSLSDGSVVRAAAGKRATSELPMHLECYRRRPDVAAVVHAHPPHAVAWAISGLALPKCVMPEAELFLGELPVVPYATTGTAALPAALSPFLAHHDAFLLASHGALAVGVDPLAAYQRMETIEQVCQVLILARQLGGWKAVSADHTRELLALRAKLGMRGMKSRATLPDAELCRAGVAGEQGLTDPDGPQPPDRTAIEAVVRRVLSRRL